MGLEVASFLNDLNVANPDGAADPKSQGDDHLRLLKSTLKATFPGLAGRFGRVQTSAIAFICALTDNWTILRMTAASTVTLLAAATAGNGWTQIVYNNSVGAVTITPAGAEKVNGAATCVIPAECVGIVVCQNVASAEYIVILFPLTGAGGIAADITGNITLGVVDFTGGTRRITATAVVTLPAIATVPPGRKITLKSVTTGDVTWIPNGAETADGLTGAVRIPSYRSFTLQSNGSDWHIAAEPDCYVGELKPISAGVTAPKGWSIADFGAISRATFAGLFAVTGVANGAGDGATTFNKFDSRGRTLIGDGTGADVEAVTASSGNGFTVAANTSKWGQGKPVVLSNLTGFVTTATAGPTYYVHRVSSTNIRLCSTLALSQNNAPDITISGGGTATLTATFTARVAGESGGEENHPLNINEMTLHNHSETYTGTVNNFGVAFGADGSTNKFITANTTGNAGGNTAMNTMQLFGVARFMVKT